MQPLKTFGMKRMMLPLAAGAFAASAFVTAQPAHAGMFGFSEQDEIKAGQQVSAQAQKEYGRALPASDPRARRVRRIGMQFAAMSTRKNIPYSYTVLQNEKVLNAFAGPGGPIFVTTKLLETTSNDAELAYVLGHETGHVQLKHIAKSVAKQQKVALGAGILGAILGRGRNGNVIGAATGIAFQAWSSGYSRDHEREADVYGVQQMAKLGYDPRAAATMLGKLSDGPDNPVNKVLADHPSSKSRQQLVRGIIEKGNLLEVARQHGGPRLTDVGSDTSVYGSRSRYASNDGRDVQDGVYPADDPNGTMGDNPADDSNTTQNDGTYDDTSGNGTINDGRYDNSADGTVDDARPAVLPRDLGAALRFVTVRGRRVVLAPAVGFARWAGADVEPNDDRGTTVLSRGDHSIELRNNSPFADVDGRSVTMSVNTQTFGGRLYAPIGNLASGTGATATYDAQRNGITLRSEDGRSLFVALPQS